MLEGSETVHKAIDVKIKLIISAIIKEATTFIVLMEYLCLSNLGLDGIES